MNESDLMQRSFDDLTTSEKAAVLKFRFENRCILPEGWTAEILMQPHDSIPYNPDIADVFYRAGYIETWWQRTLICSMGKAEERDRMVEFGLLSKIITEYRIVIEPVGIVGRFLMFRRLFFGAQKDLTG